MESVETLRWLRDCLREDRARRGIRDFDSSKVEARRFMAGRETLATAACPTEVVGPAFTQKVLERCTAYGRERELIYGALFLAGQWMGKTWCAPVILYPASVAAEGLGAITLAGWKGNPILRDELDLHPEFETGLDQIAGDGLLSADAITGIAKLLRESLPGLECNRLANFPLLTTRAELENRRGQPGLELLPASAFGLVERSPGIAGILHELDRLAQSETAWSRPLAAMFGCSNEPAEHDKNDARHIPAVLSEAQERIVRSARTNTLTLCHGPPGSGKSFTIAAIAIDHIARGQSVLIASEKDHAVDVAWEKIKEIMGGVDVAVRAGRRGYFHRLKRFVEDCLSGLITSEAPSHDAWIRERKSLDEALRESSKKEQWLAREAEAAFSHGQLLAGSSPSWWKRFRQDRVRRRLRGIPLMMEVSAELEHTHVHRIRQARRYLRTKRLVLLREAVEFRPTREALRLFLNGLRKRKPGDQETALQQVNWRTLLAMLPVWIVRLSDAHRVLPLRKEMFDVAILDESTQCDLASVLPILQRAQRVVVAGDQRQLRHVPFVSRSRMHALAKSHGISESAATFYDYRDRSLMDLSIDRATAQQQIGFLNEHFRSREHIIAFSNERFYSGGLRLMTDRPWERDRRALCVKHCGGSRDSHGVNAAEIVRIVQDLESFLESWQAKNTALKPGIGILSPFRNQVEMIGSTLKTDLPPRLYRALIQDHRLLLGTAHSFQGEERDVMFLSFTIDGSSALNAMRFLERPDVFNVSITRAQSHQRIFSSVHASQLPRPSLLADYLEYAERVRSPAVRGETVQDSFADEVQHELENQNCQVARATAVAGVCVDLLVLRNGKAVGIDLIGSPGELGEAVEQQRIRILARAGFTLLPLGFAEWRTRTNDVVREVLRYV